MSDTVLVYFTNNKGEILDTSKTKDIDRYIGDNIHYLTAFREKQLNKKGQMHLVREVTIEIFKTLLATMLCICRTWRTFLGTRLRHTKRRTSSKVFSKNSIVF